MKKEMLINVLQPEECRIAILEDGILEELYVERTGQESYVGNIYKGRIVNIEPSIQAAFVDFGIGRNGFLHVSDVEPAYYKHLEQGRGVGRRGGRDEGRGGRSPLPIELDDPLDLHEPVRNDAPEVDASGGEKRFGDGLLEDAALPPKAESTVDEPLAEVAQAGDEPAKRPKSRRGRGRRRSKKTEKGDVPGAADSTEQPEATNDDNLPPEAPTEYMGSAERRTDTDPAGGSIDDDDLFFPRSKKVPASKPAEAPKEAVDERVPAPIQPPKPEPEPAQEEFLDLGDDDPIETMIIGPDDDDEEAVPVDLTEPDDGLEAEVQFTELEFADPAGNGQDSEPSIHDEIEREYQPVSRGRGRMDRDSRPGRGGDRRGGRSDRPDRGDRKGGRGRRESGGSSARLGVGRPKPLIQEIFKRGQEVLVQVIKEGIGTKGPTLSTYISIAGRYLVLMPGLNRVGVSRKITDEEQRRRLRDIFTELEPPRGLGFIIRTAGMDKTKKELQRDLAYLSRLWQVVVRRIKKLKAPCEIYQESDMITRTIRDTFSNDIDTIWVDEPGAFEHAQEFLQIVMPRYANRIKLYEGTEPLFYRYKIEDEIARIQQRHVPLALGGSIVIDQAEALVAIDVNSGSFRADNNAEETAYQMNLQAAKEIARQLRLRDLGGVIVNDFIDMREEKHRRDVERALRDAVKRDRARTKILRISQFGIIEMTRQRIRPSLKRSGYRDCPHCKGHAQVKSLESMSIDVMRLIQLAAHREEISRVQVVVMTEVADCLLNRKRKDIARLEEAGNMQVVITPALGVSPEHLELTCYDGDGNEVQLMPVAPTRGPRRR